MSRHFPDPYISESEKVGYFILGIFATIGIVCALNWVNERDDRKIQRAKVDPTYRVQYEKECEERNSWLGKAYTERNYYPAKIINYLLEIKK